MFHFLGFASEQCRSIGDLYIPSVSHSISSAADRPGDLPTDFILALVNHLFAHTAEAFDVYPLCLRS